MSFFIFASYQPLLPSHLYILPISTSSFRNPSSRIKPGRATKSRNIHEETLFSSSNISGIMHNDDWLNCNCNNFDIHCQSLQSLHFKPSLL